MTVARAPPALRFSGSPGIRRHYTEDVHDSHFNGAAKPRNARDYFAI